MLMYNIYMDQLCLEHVFWPVVIEEESKIRKVL